MLSYLLFADSIFLFGREMIVSETETTLILRNFPHRLESAILKPIHVSDTLSIYRKTRMFGFTSMHGDTLKIYSKKAIAIVVDPGHGGHDFGAIGIDGIMEKDLTLQFGLKIYKLLKDKGYKAVLTRKSDEFVSLFERRRIANNIQAKYKIYVSLHCNFMSNMKAWGLETFFLSTSRTNTKRAVELLENMGYDEGELEDELKVIVGDILQNIYLEESQKLAFFIHDALKKYTKDRGVRQANFYVLKKIYFPSVLVELGYISNPDEAMKLKDPNYQERVSKDLIEGIENFLGWKFGVRR